MESVAGYLQFFPWRNPRWNSFHLKALLGKKKILQIIRLRIPFSNVWWLQSIEHLKTQERPYSADIQLVMISDCTRFQGSHHTCYGNHPCNFWASNGLLCSDTAFGIACPYRASGKFGPGSLPCPTSTSPWAWGTSIWLNHAGSGMFASGSTLFFCVYWIMNRSDDLWYHFLWNFI